MADTLLVPTYEQIVTILAKLAYNYSSLASVFEKVFYSDEPDDAEIEIYDESGELKTYTIENRAKALQNLLSGEGVPEGNVEGAKGALYQDLKWGDLYIKEIPGGKDGWNQVTTNTYLRNIFIQGNGSPEGVVEASKGILYIDVTFASLYIKTSETGNTGWQMISATISQFADVNLSNVLPSDRNEFVSKGLGELTAEGIDALSNLAADPSLSNLNTSGKNYFANPKLSNLDEDGEAKFDAKENVANKVPTIGAGSTDEQYPSAKCMYNLIGNLEDLINAL